ncbi:RNA polymerase sigma factor [Roseivirga sp. E12]|uniref:RNA polymerase sigma factor n=1 Tax=Roseivirga sp. E12 TaxID=2819237 RepID=UPI001ABCDAA7|nr:sigma-70 family RNA polymerase sigma factor [Roseivirga sp. E12]MBO3699667.1 sigma-70 family RNA polymerase sigma factor [Roseivirga sp. E12]
MSKNILDRDVIEVIKSGDEHSRNQAFAWLYKRHFKAVLKYVTLNSGLEDDAADIFQDSLVIFYLKVRKGEYQYESNIGTYLYAVARNLWLKKLRKARFDLTKLQLDQSYTFDEESIIQNSQLTIREALEHLGEACKHLLIDFYYNKKSMAELMEIHKLGSNEATRNKKYRCMQRLITFVNKNKIKRSDFSDEQ